MSFASVAELVAGLEKAVTGLEPGCLSGSDATSLMRLFARARKIAAAGEGLCAKRAADCAEWARTGARSAEDWLAREAGTGVGEAGRVLDTMERLAGLSATDDAIRRGELSIDQAAAITAGAAKDPAAEAELLEIARTEPLRRLREESRKRRTAGEDQAARRERHRRQRHARHWVDDDGRGHLEMVDAADVTGRLAALMSARADELFGQARKTGSHLPPPAYAADALAELIERGAAGGGDGWAPVTATVNFVVDHAAWLRGYTKPGETCEIDGVGPVAVCAVRRYVARAFVTVSTYDGADVHRVARPGRMRPAQLSLLDSSTGIDQLLRDRGVDVHAIRGNGRTIPAALETALLIRDRTCVDCDVRHRLQVDHLDPVGWGVNGPTTYDNLKRRCVHHHRLKTEQDRKQHAPRPQNRYRKPAERDAAFDGDGERGPPRTAA